MKPETKLCIRKANQSNKFLLLLVFLLYSPTLFSKPPVLTIGATSNNLSNPLFIVFVTVIILLLIIIIVLADVVKGAAKIWMDKQKFKNKSGGLGAIILLLTINSASAQSTAVVTTSVFGGLSATLFYTLLLVVCFEIFVIASLLYFIRSFLGIREMQREAALQALQSKVVKPSLAEKLNASVAIENEVSILLDHNYDGIQELDNNLPPWWKYGFYLTILFAFVYMLHYHVFKTGNLQGAKYTKELAQAAIDVAAYQKKSALSVDENSVKMLLDKESIENGKNIFITNCVACHGKFGEGQVGPNLTDDYWLHGGKINDVFKTIKYGYPDKGMKSWKEDLSPSQINCVASYTKTLHGTNPVNPKEKEGELYIEKTESDTSASVKNTSAKADSLALTNNIK